MRTLLLFVATALAEIVVCYLPDLWLREGKSSLLLIPAAGSLALAGMAVIMAAPRGT